MLMADRRAGFNGPTGSSVPPQLQCFVATKKTVELARWGAKPVSDFRVAGEGGNSCGVRFLFAWPMCCYVVRAWGVEFGCENIFAGGQRIYLHESPGARGGFGGQKGQAFAS